MSGYCDEHFRKIERQIELLVQAQAQFQVQLQQQLQLQAQQQQQKQNDINLNVANTGDIDLVLVAVLVRLAFGAENTDEAARVMDKALEASHRRNAEMAEIVKSLVAK